MTTSGCGKWEMSARRTEASQTVVTRRSVVCVLDATLTQVTGDHERAAGADTTFNSQSDTTRLTIA